MLDSAARLWKQDILEAAEDRFERRLSEEGAALRLEMAAVRLEIAKSRNSVQRWQFACWLTTMLTILLKRF
jgi:hypothetical protein